MIMLMFNKIKYTQEYILSMAYKKQLTIDLTVLIFLLPFGH